MIQRVGAQKDRKHNGFTDPADLIPKEISLIFRMSIVMQNVRAIKDQSFIYFDKPNSLIFRAFAIILEYAHFFTIFCMNTLPAGAGDPIIPDLKGEMPVIPQPPSKTKFSRKVLTYLDFGLDLLVIFLIVVFVRSYVIAPFQVSGASMTNTLQDQEYILVNKMLYHGLLGLNFGHPERGDIVVIEPPLERKIYYIKRVIGLPGDTVKFLDNGVMIFNKEHPEGFVLEENYLRCNQDIDGRKLNTCDYTRLSQKEFIVPEDSYFVMGDNRNNSTDSRYCFASCTAANATPFVKLEHIVGKTWFVVWPINDFRTFSDQKYEDPAGGN